MSKGYESLVEAVKRDCAHGEGCFNPNGCDKEFFITVPEDNPELRKYFKTACKHNVKCFHNYCDKFKWVIDRAKHYGEKLNIPWESILDSWEEMRSYSWNNYYQEANQPEIKHGKVKVFETVDDLTNSFNGLGFRCPRCNGVSSSPYECDSGKEIESGKKCDWKVYGLFKDMGKGVFVYVKDQLRGETIFIPVAWENDQVDGD